MSEQRLSRRSQTNTCPRPALAFQISHRSVLGAHVPGLSLVQKNRQRDQDCRYDPQYRVLAAAAFFFRHGTRVQHSPPLTSSATLSL
jgi:hypothetical protein